MQSGLGWHSAILHVSIINRLICFKKLAFLTPPALLWRCKPKIMAEGPFPGQQPKLKIWHDARMGRVSECVKPGVIVYRPIDISGASHQRLIDAGCRVAVADPDEEIDLALGRLSPVQALIGSSLRGERLERSRISALSDLRIIAKYTIGVDDIDLDAATELGILVTHCPTEANFGGVAEGTVALMLALLKKIGRRDAQVRAGGWRADWLQGTYLGARDDGYPGITLGIIGLGRIGRRVAELMGPWRIRLVAADPYVSAETFARYGVERMSLDPLLRQADVVSVHCQLTDETDRLISRRELALMKPDAILINTARGRIVDIEAVCDALAAGRIGGAAFDVLPEEPPAAGARILSTDDRVILSPHMVAANAGGTLTAAIPWATDAVLEALAGRVPANVYNEDVIEAWRARFADESLLPAQAQARGR
jgi:phosphoglycerate dehydrogenase-like enzyme